MKFNIPNSNQCIILSPEVIETFTLFCQDSKSSESGGLLFADFCFPEIIVKLATKPNNKDICSRFSFIPCRNIQRKTIYDKFKTNLHYIGEWHTHPILNPMPSNLDINSMKETFIKSKHELNFLLMIIVGSSKDNLRLWCSLHNAKEMIQLHGV